MLTRQNVIVARFFREVIAQPKPPAARKLTGKEISHEERFGLSVYPAMVPSCWTHCSCQRQQFSMDRPFFKAETTLTNSLMDSHPAELIFSR